jgi:hypothetical protein
MIDQKLKVKWFKLIQKQERIEYILMKFLDKIVKKYKISDNDYSRYERFMFDFVFETNTNIRKVFADYIFEDVLLYYVKKTAEITPQGKRPVLNYDLGYLKDELISDMFLYDRKTGLIELEAVDLWSDYGEVIEHLFYYDCLKEVQDIKEKKQ